jgi:hypothetical protein
MLFATTVWVVIDEKSFTCNGHRKHILAGPLLTEYLNQALTRKNFRVIKNARGISTVKGQGILSTRSGIRGKTI